MMVVMSIRMLYEHDGYWIRKKTSKNQRKTWRNSKTNSDYYESTIQNNITPDIKKRDIKTMTKQLLLY